MNYYTELYGKDNVLILPYEQLRTSPAEFVSKVCHFCGSHYSAKTVSQLVDTPSRPNTSLSVADTAIQAKMNRIFVQHPENLYPLL